MLPVTIPYHWCDWYPTHFRVVCLTALDGIHVRTCFVFSAFSLIKFGPGFLWTTNCIVSSSSVILKLKIHYCNTVIAVRQILKYYCIFLCIYLWAKFTVIFSESRFTHYNGKFELKIVDSLFYYYYYYYYYNLFFLFFFGGG